jgi:hypothetical protein
MKSLLKIEEGLMMALCLVGLHHLKADWWAYPLFLLGPDVSMIGYLAGQRAGAWSYNIFHHKGIASALILFGYATGSVTLMLTGLILLGHSSMDRMFGFGLKLETGFKDTHLGRIGA